MPLTLDVTTKSYKLATLNGHWDKNVNFGT